MAVIYQYDRRYELIIGDARKPDEALFIGYDEADKTDRSLQITFDITKSADAKKTGGNAATIEIVNLNEESLKKIQQSPFLAFQFKVGYADTGVKLLLAGQVTQVSTKKQGADWVTTITAGEGYVELNQSKLKKSLPPGITIEQAIEECRKGMPNIDKGIYSGTNKNAIAIDGYPLTGSAKEMLQEICEANRIEWRVDRGALYISDEAGINDKNYKNTAFVLNGETGLLGSPFWTQADGRKLKDDKTRRQSVQFQALLNPLIIPGSVIKIESRFINGFFKVTSARYSGSFRGGNWTVDAYGTEVLTQDVPKD